VTQVRLEYAPEPASEYLGDRTAFDAFVAYKQPDGSDAFLGIEIKLTETFSPRAYEKLSYCKLTRRTGSPWKVQTWSQLSDGRWNQLWRDHLLVEAVRLHPNALHGVHGRLMLVRHRDDKQCQQIVERYQSFLVDPAASFVDVPLDTLVEARSAGLREDECAWLDGFRERYLDLSLSEPAWRQCRESYPSRSRG
jgi:hypothetical protein